MQRLQYSQHNAYSQRGFRASATANDTEHTLVETRNTHRLLQAIY